MITILLLGTAYAGLRLAVECVAAVRSLPRCNDDMVFF